VIYGKGDEQQDKSDSVPDFLHKGDISNLITRVEFIFLFGLDFSEILIDRCSCNFKSNLQMLTSYISL
jgi:hypothetical protein